MSQRRIPVIRGPAARDASRLFDGVRVVRARVLEDLAEARSDIERARQEAAEVGYREGLARAVRELAHAERARADLMHAAQRDLVDLAFGLAEKVVHASLDRDAFAHLVDEQLQQVRGDTSIILRVSPDDAEGLAPGDVDGVAVVLVADPGLAAGDCVVQTEHGTVDARISVRLDTLRRSLGWESR